MSPSSWKMFFNSWIIILFFFLTKVSIHAFWINLITKQSKSNPDFKLSAIWENIIEKNDEKIIHDVYDHKYDFEGEDPDNPNQKYIPRKNKFLKRFLVIAQKEKSSFIPPDMWTLHQQWIRRTRMIDQINLPYIKYYDKIPNMNLTNKTIKILSSSTCCITNAYSILAPNRFNHTNQLFFIESNSTEDLQAYLEKDPLNKLGFYSSLHYFELERQSWYRLHKLRPMTDTENVFKELDFYEDKLDSDVEDEILTGDLYAPYLFLAYPRNNSSMHQQALLNKSRDHHITCATSNEENSLLKFNNIYSRVHYLGHLKDSNSSETFNNSIGQVLIFNANSNKEAFRYISLDPFFQSFNISSLESFSPLGHFQTKEYDLILTPLNVLDDNGLHHMLPNNFREKSTLDPFLIHDPADPLRIKINNFPNGYSFQGSQEYQDALDFMRNHYAENNRVLNALKHYNISLEYDHSRLTKVLFRLYQYEIRKIQMENNSNSTLNSTTVVPRKSRISKSKLPLIDDNLDQDREAKLQLLLEAQFREAKRLIKARQIFDAPFRNFTKIPLFPDMLNF